MHESPPASDIPGDAHRGGGLSARRLRLLPGRILRLVRGGHFAPNPYVRNGWDQRIDAHTLAIAGHPAPDDRSGGRAHGDGGLATTGNGGPEADVPGVREADVPGVRDGDARGKLLHVLANRNGGANAAATGGADDAPLPADAGARVVPIRRRLAPYGGYVTVVKIDDR
jgi:hypothetical protein